MRLISKKLTLWLVGIATLLLLAGCMMDTPNGEVPEKYMPYVQKYVGKYNVSYESGGDLESTTELSFAGNTPR